MFCVRKAAKLLLVLATGTSMLFAGTPHFECRCADGTFKPICFGPISSESSCCCSGSCGDGCCGKNSSSKGKPEKNAPCCGQKTEAQTGSEPDSGGATSGSGEKTDRRAGRDRVEGPMVSGTCCHRTLAQADVQCLTRAETKASERSQTTLVLLPVVKFGYAMTTPGREQTVWDLCRLPPPTDLITILQRLTI